MLCLFLPIEHSNSNSSILRVCLFFKEIVIFLFIMSNQKIIIYKFTELYQILEELSLELNYKIIQILDEKSFKDQLNSLSNFVVISNKKISDIQNLIIIDNYPIKLFKLIEKINIKFLKLQFGNQSQIKVSRYYLDLNSREMFFKNIKLKLTEKEINTIIFLSKNQNPVSINNLEKSVWKYQSVIETHTVETHIYRLRKKILQSFNDSQFIISTKHGYQIN